MSLSRLDLSRFGNVPKDYLPKVHSIKPFSPIENPYSIIKPYSMRSISKPYFSQESIGLVGRLIAEKMSLGIIDPKMGLGFLILSNGYLNVSMWGGEYPSLLNNAIFSFERVDEKETSLDMLTKDSLKIEDIRKVGTYCVWELGVVIHETNAWLNYLYSQRKDADKLRYIQNALAKTNR